MNKSKIIIKNEKEMMVFGENFAKNLKKPAVIELVGDVGAGKTTFTRGLAKGLGVEEDVTSPSFVISKKYYFADGELTHYDFYRLDEPGLMADDLFDSLSQENSVVVVEWAENVRGVLPENRIIVKINYLDDGTREVELEEK